MRHVDQTAASAYVVERIESDLLTSTRRMVWRAAGGLGRGTPLVMPPAPDPNRPLVMPEADADEVRRGMQGDLVRIMDREGNVVWWREFKSREGSMKKYAEIMDDLMKLDPATFRGKYAIIPDRPPGVDAPVTTENTAAPAPGSAADPNGPWADPLGAWTDRVRQSEGGADWDPTTQAGGRREGDVGWGEFGQR